MYFPPPNNTLYISCKYLKIITYIFNNQGPEYNQSLVRDSRALLIANNTVFSIYYIQLVIK